MSTAIITREAVVRFTFPAADECQEGDRVVILRGGSTLVAERRNGAWVEFAPPSTDYHPTTADEVLEREIASMLCQFDDSDLTSFESARKIIRMVRQADRAKRPDPGAKYRDTSTGDEYELGPDLQWRRIDASGTNEKGAG